MTDISDKAVIKNIVSKSHCCPVLQLGFLLDIVKPVKCVLFAH